MTQTHNTVPASGSAFLTDLQTFLREEDAERYADLFSDRVVSGGVITPGAGLTKTPSALVAYAAGYYVTESGSITFTDATTTWVIANKDTTGNSGGFTRVSGTHYLTAAGADPGLPAGAIRIATVTTAGGSVTVVTDTRVLFSIGLAQGGVGLNLSTAGNGRLLIGNGAGLTLANLTQGTGMSVTNGAGSITLATAQDIATTASPTFVGATLTGGLNVATPESMTQFFPAALHCQVTSSVADPIVVRVAANDYGLRRTAGAAETINYGFTIPLILSATANKGMRLDSFSIVHQITVAALTSNTFNALATTTYANNVANAVAAHGGAITITMPTATQANPYVTAATIGTPAFVNATAKQISLDWTAVLQNTTVYTVYGVIGTYSAAWY